MNKLLFKTQAIDNVVKTTKKVTSKGQIRLKDLYS